MNNNNSQLNQRDITSGQIEQTFISSTNTNNKGNKIMNNLTTTPFNIKGNDKDTATITSYEIWKQSDKGIHRDLMRTIKRLIIQGDITSPQIEETKIPMPNGSQKTIQVFVFNRLQAIAVLGTWSFKHQIQLIEAFDALEKKYNKLVEVKPPTLLEQTLRLAEQLQLNEEQEMEITFQKQQNAIKTVALMAKVEELSFADVKIEEDKPKVAHYTKLVDDTGLITTNAIAHTLNLTAYALNQRLKNLGIQYKTKECWLLYAKYRNQGLAEVKHFYKYGTVSKHLKWKQKGLQFILNLIEADNAERKL